MQDAKRRFFRLMKLMCAASFLVTAAAFAWFRFAGVPTPWPFVAAIALAVFGSLMLAAALMGLVFFSAASGADDSVDKLD
ncbi:MAG: hypothetical protein ACRC1J_10310 [Sandaracinobacteroides sp.]